MMPTPPSQVRQNYRLECEAALNCHAALEFHASFQCLALAFYLDRDDVGLKHFYRFFLLRSHEHSKTAESLMFLQNQRGGRVSFFDIRKPETQQLGECTPGHARHPAPGEVRQPEPARPAQAGHRQQHAHLCDFLETGYLDQQVKFIKELGDHVSNLSNVGSPEGSLAEYFFDKLTLGDGDKED